MDSHFFLAKKTDTIMKPTKETIMLRMIVRTLVTIIVINLVLNVLVYVARKISNAVR